MLAALVDNTPVGFAFLDPQLRYMRVNAALAQTNGLPVEAHPGRSLREVNPGLAHSLEPLLQRVMDSSVPVVNLEVSGEGKGTPGALRHTLVSVFAVHSPTGKFFGLAVFVLDNTEHKQTQEALLDNQAVLQNLFESAPDAIVVVDPQGIIQRLNAQVKNLFGYEHDELLGQRVEVLIPERFHNPHLSHRKTYSDAAVARPMGAGLELYARRKDGSEFPVDIMLSPMGTGGLVIATVRDIGERTRLQADLRRSEQRFRQALRGSNIVVSQLDTQLRYTWIHNPHPSFKPEDIVGKRDDELIPLQYATPLMELMRAALETGAVQQGEWQVVFDGVGYTYGVRIEPQHGEKGEVTGLATVGVDISERKRLEAEREHLLNQSQQSEREALLLAQIASSLSLSDPLETNLNQIASLIVKATDAISCTIRLYNQEMNDLPIAGSHNQPQGLEAAFHRAIVAGLEVPAVRAVKVREMYIEHHFRQRALADPHYSVLHEILEQVTWDTVVAAPLLQHRRVLGAILFCYPPQHEPTTTDLLQLSTIASQVALVLENARLYAEASAKAALEERQKLARELHDSVSQALYGISLGLQSATLSLKGPHPESSEAELAYARQMTETAIAEMKSLIFELRPESLEQEGLVVALQKHLRAAELRHGFEFDLNLGQEPPISLKAKEMLYRIAQEAINNAIKHAQTRHMRLALKATPNHVVLEIADSGSGFDPTQSFPGHLGLRSMRERTELLGGHFEIQSSPGSGTRIRVSLPPTA